MKATIKNKHALELIKLIEDYGLFATPIIYNAFYKGFYEGHTEIAQLLEQYHNCSQADIETHLRQFIGDQDKLNANISKFSKSYSDATSLFFAQSHIQNEQYKSDIKHLKDKNTSIKAPFDSNLSESIDNIESSRFLFETKMLAYEKKIKALTSSLKKAQEASQRDYLTGVLNRQSYHNTLNLWLKHYRTINQPLCLAVFDIDHFKKFNDKYGHIIGDEVLTHFAQTLEKEVRHQDYVFRYGGEEFTVLFPNTTLQNALQICERIRTRIESRTINSREEDMAIEMVTVSCGITQAIYEDTELTIFKRADKNLYKAKQLGRNRIEIDIDSN